ncbi:MAG: hypothetical protein ACE5J9_09925 [Methanosarcinales archaeon]
MKLKTKAILMLTIFFVASATLGCIGEKPEEVTPTPTPTVTPEETPTPTPTPTLEKTPVPTPTVTVTETPTVVAPENVTTHTVWIDKYALAPSVSKISIGDTVKWINMDRQNQITYTISSDTGAWDTFDIKFLKNHTITFDKLGVYNYTAEGATVKINGSIIVE